MSPSSRPGRPVGLALLVSLVIAALLIGVAPAAAAERKAMALGVSMPDGRNVGALDAFARSVGKRPALWSVWTQWGRRGGHAQCYPHQSGTCAFPRGTADQLARRGVTPVIWWEPVDPERPNDSRYARHKNILQGRHDAYIRRWAREARAFGRANGASIILRFAHEHNGGYFPWGIRRFDNSASTFKRAWRHVWRIFRQEGALPYVDFLWSVTKQKCRGCNPFRKVYPGHRYVDYAGISAFNWGSRKRWKSMERILAGPVRSLMRVTRKPIIVAELASSPSGGDRARWIRRGYNRAYKRWARVHAIMYLNSGQPRVTAGHPDWRLVSGSDRSALEAYGSVARRPRFSGTLP